jgi:hypothetical protein
LSKNLSFFDAESTAFKERVQILSMAEQDEFVGHPSFPPTISVNIVDIACHGLNFAQYYRNPPPGRSPKQVVMQYAIDDGNVLNEISEAQAIVMDLPLLKKVYRATPWLRYGKSGGIDGFEQGYGIYQLPYLVTDAEQKLAQAEIAQQKLVELYKQSGKELTFRWLILLTALSTTTCFDSRYI